MKIIITESQKENLFKSIVKNQGWGTAASLVGGPEELVKIAFNNNPREFLNIYNDLDVVQSRKSQSWSLFRYKKGHNLMIYDKNPLYVYISYDDIWSFLEKGFGLNYTEIQELTEMWLDEVHNLRGIKVFTDSYINDLSLDEV